MGKDGMKKTVYVVAGIYNDGDGAVELVSNAIWYDAIEEAKKRAFEWAHTLYSEWLGGFSGKTLDGRKVGFGDVWEKVDNGDPEFMDWGFDPVDDWGVSSVRIRVFKAYKGVV